MSNQLYPILYCGSLTNATYFSTHLGCQYIHVPLAKKPWLVVGTKEQRDEFNDVQARITVTEDNYGVLPASETEELENPS